MIPISFFFYVIKRMEGLTLIPKILGNLTFPCSLIWGARGRKPLILWVMICRSLAKVFNKTIMKLLKKTILKSQKDWHERLVEVFWACCTLTEYQLSQCHIDWFLELKLSYNSKSKFHLWGFPCKTNSPMKIEFICVWMNLTL